MSIRSLSSITNLDIGHTQKSMSRCPPSPTWYVTVIWSCSCRSSKKHSFLEAVTSIMWAEAKEIRDSIERTSHGVCRHDRSTVILKVVQRVVEHWQKVRVSRKLCPNWETNNKTPGNLLIMRVFGVPIRNRISLCRVECSL